MKCRRIEFLSCTQSLFFYNALADQLRPKGPKLAALMDDAEADVLAFMTFPKDHRPKIHSINPLERLNGEIKRRTPMSSSCGRPHDTPWLREYPLGSGDRHPASAPSLGRYISTFNG